MLNSPVVFQVALKLRARITRETSLRFTLNETLVDTYVVCIQFKGKTLAVKQSILFSFVVWRGSTIEN